MDRSTAKSILKFFGWMAATCGVLLLAAFLFAAHLYTQYEQRAAKFDLSKIDDVAERSAVYDANGELYSYFGGMNRMVVPLNEVSKNFQNAVIAREDSRFWEHKGVDYFGIARAFVTNVLAGDKKQGASTITQQLARNACELHGKTLDRKALEAVLAQRIERNYTKEQILELYLNRIYFGAGFYGIETASRGYFGKSAKDLNLGEAAVLAGLIRSPNRFSPSRDPEAARTERDTVLDRMQELKMVGADEVVAAKATKVNVIAQKGMRHAEDYVMQAVIEELEEKLAPDVLELGGINVWMTVDPQLQRLAQASADRCLTEIEEKKGYDHPTKAEFRVEEGQEKPTDYLQAGVVAIENKTGAIRAIVGGRDYKDSRFSRAVSARRQIGSTFKPFVYAAAFERGLLPGTIIEDAQIMPGEFKRYGDWSPANSDGEYLGPQPAALGLLKSRNTMTVRVGEYAGFPKIREIGREAGLAEEIPDLPSTLLGAFETTLENVTAAYTVFPNQGVRRKPFLIARVEDREGRLLLDSPSEEHRVMSAGTAWMVSAIMQQIMKTGTAAKSASLGWEKPGAGKTGTTNDFHDAWFIGYTGSLTTGVWVGFDTPQTIGEKAYGSALALPIWVDFMKNVPEKRYPAQAFVPPKEIATVQICSTSGLRATSQCVAHGLAYDASLPRASVPTGLCRTHPELPTYAAQPVNPYGAPTPYVSPAPAGGTVVPLPPGAPTPPIVVAPPGIAATPATPPAAVSSVTVTPPATPVATVPPAQTASAPIRMTNQPPPLRVTRGYTPSYQTTYRSSGTVYGPRTTPAPQPSTYRGYTSVPQRQTRSQRQVQVVEEDSSQTLPARPRYPVQPQTPSRRTVEVRRAQPVNPTPQRVPPPPKRGFVLFGNDDDD